MMIAGESEKGVVGRALVPTHSTGSDAVRVGLEVRCRRREPAVVVPGVLVAIGLAGRPKRRRPFASLQSDTANAQLVEAQSRGHSRMGTPAFGRRKKALLACGAAKMLGAA